MANNLLKEINNEMIHIFHDDRGRVVSFSDQLVCKNLHIASMEPGAIRGNHVHNRDEIICIIGGKGICEIFVEDNPGRASERIHVDGNIKTYRIKSGAKHTVYNIGEKEFFLIAFFSECTDKGSKDEGSFLPISAQGPG